MTQLNEDLKMCAEYMGAALKENGQWTFFHGHQPTSYYREDATHIEFRYNSDWNWQIKLFSKVMHDMARSKNFSPEKFLDLHENYWAALRENDPAAGFAAIVESLRFLKNSQVVFINEN